MRGGHASNEGSPQGIALLGSTGSIGTQALQIARLFPEKIRIRSLAAFRSVDQLVAQAEEFAPECVVIGDASLHTDVAARLSHLPIRVLAGDEGMKEAATLEDVQVVLAAVVGFAGLASVIAGIEAGKTIALANKETLVAGGALVNKLLRKHDGKMIPVDSEHSAIFQCLVGEPAGSVEMLTLTASGGPFRNRPKSTFDSITLDEALNHPNWSMGAKITVDSASMMNKGLEVIEARWLFDLPAEQIEVLVHPQSIIHSMVAFKDGSSKAQLGVPDMRVPIQYALSYPGRWEAPHPRLNWSEIAQLDFQLPDTEKFPCLRLAFDALKDGGLAPAVLNAANEAAVELFLNDRIRFTMIPELIAAAMARFSNNKFSFSDNPSLDELVAVHQQVLLSVQELKQGQG